MKRIRFLLIALFAFITFEMSSQTIEGGSGIIVLSTGADPNAITSLATQTWTAGEAVYAVDPHTATVWIYNNGNAPGSKWEQVGVTGLSTASDGNTVNFTTTGGNITAEVILDVNSENDLTSSATGLMMDAAVDGVTDAANGIDVSINPVGDLLTVDLDVNELTTETVLDPANDFIPIYDASSTSEKKVSLANIRDGNGIYSGSGALSGNTTVTGTGNMNFSNTGGFQLNPTNAVSIAPSGVNANVTIQATGVFATSSINATTIDAPVLNLASNSGTATQVIIGEGNNDELFIPALNYTGRANGDVLVVTDITTGKVGMAAANSLGTDDQTLDVATVTANTLNLSIEGDGAATVNLNLSSRLTTYYIDDAAATTGGIAAEGEYKLDTGNPYGQPKGTIRVRQ